MFESERRVLCVGLLDVNSAGLGMLAERCHSWGAEIRACCAVRSVEASWQATAAVVIAIHTDVAVAGQMMVARMKETATRLSAAGTEYGAGDKESAGRLSGLVSGV